jgi:NTP pyrophosphatase (non-canonical NTP hydrolase)
MTMTAAGVAKLIEECGELQQVLGKKLAMWDQDEHWDGTNLLTRMAEEMGDVQAALAFVADEFSISALVWERAVEKGRLFDTWQDQIDNNDHGIDGPVARVQTALAQLDADYAARVHGGLAEGKALRTIREAVDGLQR